MAEPGFTLIDDGQAVEVAYGDGVERAGHAQRAGRPVALDLDERAAYLGVPASARAAAPRTSTTWSTCRRSSGSTRAAGSSVRTTWPSAPTPSSTSPGSRPRSTSGRSGHG